MTPNQWFLAGAIAVWLLGTPVSLMLECWLDEKHIITRKAIICAPLVGWFATWMFVAIVVCMGPFVLIGAGFDWVKKRFFPSQKPKRPSSFKEWLETPAISCRRKL